jgi:NAD(P)H-dependent flavin oxidoreductase YrpB (nitropropane dioxygenase family)
MIETELTRKFGLGAPIVQAGMAFAGMTPALAVAVCEAQALGSIAIGLMPPPAMSALIGAVRSATARPFHVNFITIYTDDAHIDTLVEHKPAAASFHWGHPKRTWIDRLHGAGIAVIEQVGSIETARAAADDSVDVIVAQGAEAGGHNFAALPSFVLVPAVVEAVAPLPVLAAGGVMNGRGLAAALCLGAAGAWIGTRFVMSEEASVHAEYKRRLCAANGTETVLSSLFGRHHTHFNPMRVLRNRIVASYAGREDAAPSDNSGEPIVGVMSLLGQRIELRRFTNLVPMTDAEGDLEELPLLAGQGVGLVSRIMPAGAIVQEIASEAEQVLYGRGWKLS